MGEQLAALVEQPPSLVAILAPRWITVPSQRTIPVDGSTGRMKLIFISSDV